MSIEDFTGKSGAEIAKILKDYGNGSMSDGIRGIHDLGLWQGRGQGVAIGAAGGMVGLWLIKDYAWPWVAEKIERHKEYKRILAEAERMEAEEALVTEG